MTHEERVCPACGGNGAYWPDARICGPCQGSGAVTTCMGCGDDMPEPEAFREGEFCIGCREALDHKESAS